MEASRAHAEGKPFLSDEQYDDLKRQLRRDRSTVVAQASSFLLHSLPRRPCTGEVVMAAATMRLGTCGSVVTA